MERLINDIARSVFSGKEPALPFLWENPHKSPKGQEEHSFPESSGASPNPARKPMEAAIMIHSLLSSTRNTRFLPCKNHRLIRSDAILNPSGEDIALLSRGNVRTVLDLRSGKEIRALPCPLGAIPRFSYFPASVNGGQRLSHTAEDIVEDYLSMTDSELMQTVRLLEASEDGALYFCHSGKDRTGVVSALLLLREGVSGEAIVSDYLLSWEEDFSDAQIPALRKRVMTEYLRRVTSERGGILR